MHNDQTPPPGYAGVQLCHSPVEGCEPLQAAGASMELEPIRWLICTTLKLKNPSAC